MEGIALLLIDVQEGLDNWEYYGMERNNPGAEKNIKLLLDAFRKYKLPVIHFKHNSSDPKSPLAKGKLGNNIKAFVMPKEAELVLEKNQNSAFSHPGLYSYLRNQETKSLVIAGLTLEHCVASTVRSASDLGFKVFLPADATASFSKVDRRGKYIPSLLVHEITLANLKNEFAQICVTTEMLELIHPE